MTDDKRLTRLAINYLTGNYSHSERTRIFEAISKRFPDFEDKIDEISGKLSQIRQDADSDMPPSYLEVINDDTYLSARTEHIDPDSICDPAQPTIEEIIEERWTRLSPVMVDFLGKDSAFRRYVETLQYYSYFGLSGDSLGTASHCAFEAWIMEDFPDLPGHERKRQIKHVEDMIDMAKKNNHHTHCALLRDTYSMLNEFHLMMVYSRRQG